VRVYPHRDVEAVMRTISLGELRPSDALLTYLLMFHGLRNDEVLLVTGHGLADSGQLWEFGVHPPRPRLSAGGSHPARRVDMVPIPTARYPWLGHYVDEYLHQRARAVKHPDNPFLFVGESWRQGDGTMHRALARDAVARVTERACGYAMRPSLLRLSMAAHLASLSDHTIIEHLGWCTSRAVQIAFGPREIVTGLEPRRAIA
jgi:hypothetical protein